MVATRNGAYVCTECRKRISRKQNQTHGVCDLCLQRKPTKQNKVQDILPKLLATEDEWDLLEQHAQAIRSDAPLPAQISSLLLDLAKMQNDLANDISLRPGEAIHLVNKILSLAASLDAPIAVSLRAYNQQLVQPILDRLKK